MSKTTKKFKQWRARPDVAFLLRRLHEETEARAFQCEMYRMQVEELRSCRSQKDEEIKANLCNELQWIRQAIEAIVDNSLSFAWIQPIQAGWVIAARVHDILVELRQLRQQVVNQNNVAVHDELEYLRNAMCNVNAGTQQFVPEEWAAPLYYSDDKMRAAAIVQVAKILSEEKKDEMEDLPKPKPTPRPDPPKPQIL